MKGQFIGFGGVSWQAHPYKGGTNNRGGSIPQSLEGEEPDGGVLEDLGLVEDKQPSGEFP